MSGARVPLKKVVVQWMAVGGQVEVQWMAVGGEVEMPKLQPPPPTRQPLKAVQSHPHFVGAWFGPAVLPSQFDKKKWHCKKNAKKKHAKGSMSAKRCKNK